MKPVTPQDYAQDYGIFIADMLVVAKKLPSILTWFNTNLPDVALVYKTNPVVFVGYTPSIKSFPEFILKSKNKEGASSKETQVAQAAVTLAWTSITIDLKNALLAAEVDPSTAATILASFAKLKPSIKGGGK